MKMKGFLVILFVIIFTVGCKREMERPMPIYQYTESLEKMVFYEDDILDFPSDIVCDNEFIYVANQGNDTVLILDYNGELVHVLGGNEQEEVNFISPETIAVTNDFIYIAEKDSCRIYVFNKKYEFQKVIIIEKLKKEVSVKALDIEADEDGNIYLSVIGTKSKLLKAYRINNKDEVKELGKNMIGIYAKDSDNKIYYAQSFQYIKNGYQDGENYVYDLSSNKLKKLFQLPFKYSPTSFSISEDKMYLFSYNRCQIDEFLMDGTYVQTLYQENATHDNSEMKHFAMNKNKFFMTDSKNNVIYVLTPKGE